VVLAAITVYIVDREFAKAASFAGAGAVLTFFGLMHGEAIGINQTPTVALSYLVVSGVLIGCAKYAVVTKPAAEMEEIHGGLPELAE
jgi:AGZA family xanthine/uracil permease-like MFS transporter